MGYFKHKLSAADISARLKVFETYMRQHALGVTSDSGIDYFYMKALDAETVNFYDQHIMFLRCYNLIQIIPVEDGYCFSIVPPIGKDTVTKTHIRLPKLSHLITLTPDDFFAFFRILKGAGTTAGNALSLNVATADIQAMSSAISPFFLQLQVNYRIDPAVADLKWTSREDIKFIAKLPPTAENQLYAMQYLTAVQNKDLLYFPIESAVSLELNGIDELDDNYCVPPQRA